MSAVSFRRNEIGEIYDKQGMFPLLKRNTRNTHSVTRWSVFPVLFRPVSHKTD